MHTDDRDVLAERVRKLGREKSYLQLIFTMMNRIISVPGLENVIENLLKGVVDCIGGTNLILYYLIDHELFSVDIYGVRNRLDRIDDETVRQVFESRQPHEAAHDFRDTWMTTPAFTTAFTWTYPLVAGNDMVGVFKMEGLHIGMRGLCRYLPTLFGYAALVLNNEIRGRTRLQKALDKVSREIALRKETEEELRRAQETLEERVQERTRDLRRSEEKYRRIVETANEGIWVMDRDHRTTFVNGKMEEMLGYGQGEILGLPVEHFLFPEEMDDHRCRMQERHNGENGSYERRFRRRDGGECWCFVSATPLHDEQGLFAGSFGMFTDITASRRSAMLLKARLRLSGLAGTHTLEDVLRTAVDEAELLTGSRIGFFHTLDADRKNVRLQAWSSATLRDWCTVGNGTRHFPLDEAGVWTECVREGRPVIHNDYQCPEHRTGLPAGHPPILRELVVPVMREGTATAVLGVGNKEYAYDDRDTEALSSLADMTWDIVVRKLKERELRDSLHEKEVLLREVHHRVKNNLAAVIGLLEMQQQGISDAMAVACLQDLSARIKSMALVHERLYRSENMARINFREYLGSLVSHLCTSFAVRPRISCSVEATGVELGLDLAVPCALVINELVTNAIKHAFPAGKPGSGSGDCEIRIMAGAEGDDITMQVADNGVGLPPGLDWRNCPSLGLRLVRMLGEYQLGGTIRLDRAEGTCFAVRFTTRRREHHGR